MDCPLKILPTIFTGKHLFRERSGSYKSPEN